MEKPREIVVHQSANRPNLLLGADRELVLLSAMLSASHIFVISSWRGILLGVLLWVAAVAILKRMGKADPMGAHERIASQSTIHPLPSRRIDLSLALKAAIS